jgi:hypothetical protein
MASGDPPLIYRDYVGFSMIAEDFSHMGHQILRDHGNAAGEVADVTGA